MENIMSTLFPKQNDAVIPFIPTPTIEEFVPISEEELLNAANKINEQHKASGPVDISQMWQLKRQSKLNQSYLSISITSVY